MAKRVTKEQHEAVIKNLERVTHDYRWTCLNLDAAKNQVQLLSNQLAEVKQQMRLISHIVRDEQLQAIAEVLNPVRVVMPAETGSGSRTWTAETKDGQVVATYHGGGCQTSSKKIDDPGPAAK